MKRVAGFVMLIGLSISNVMAQSDCPVFVQQALQRIGDVCATTQRNQACYGNGQIAIDPQPNVRLMPFDTVGDMVALSAIQSLTLSPLDTATDAWGLSLLQVQASLPDTLPGQNVTMLVSGDVELGHESDSLEAYYFSGGIGDGGCNSAPNGIMIQTPEGAGQVELTLNNMTFSVGSTLFLSDITPDTLAAELDIATLSADTNPQLLDVAREQMDDETQLLSVTLLEGHVTVASAELQATLTPLSTFVMQPMGDEGMFKPVATYTLPLETLIERFHVLASVLPEPLELEAVAADLSSDDVGGDCISPRSGTWQMSLISSDVSQCQIVGDSLINSFSKSPSEYIEFADDFVAEELVASVSGGQDMGEITISQLDTCIYQVSASPSGTTVDLTFTLQDQDTFLYDYAFSVVDDGFDCTAILNIKMTRIGD